MSSGFSHVHMQAALRQDLDRLRRLLAHYLTMVYFQRLTGRPCTAPWAGSVRHMYLLNTPQPTFKSATAKVICQRPLQAILYF